MFNKAFFRFTLTLYPWSACACMVLPKETRPMWYTWPHRSFPAPKTLMRDIIWLVLEISNLSLKPCIFQLGIGNIIKSHGDMKRSSQWFLAWYSAITLSWSWRTIQTDRLKYGSFRSIFSSTTSPENEKYYHYFSSEAISIFVVDYSAQDTLHSFLDEKDAV